MQQTQELGSLNQEKIRTILEQVEQQENYMTLNYNPNCKYPLAHTDVND